MRARGRLQQSQASIPSAPRKYNARLYGRGLSKIAHSEGDKAGGVTRCPMMPEARASGQSAKVAVKSQAHSQNRLSKTRTIAQLLGFSADC
jgi:hypothetical protein